MKGNIIPTKIWSGHLHLGSKLLAKIHESNSSGFLDILLTRFSLALVWKGALLLHEDSDRKEKPRWQRAITQEVSSSIYSNVNQVNYFSLIIYSLGFKALALIGFDCADKFSSLYFLKATTQGTHIALTRHEISKP